jgi:predicted PurR-regulated permease PerM
MRDAQISPQPEDPGRSQISPMVIYTALIGALVSLIIAILRQGKWRETEFARRYAARTTDHRQPQVGFVQAGGDKPSGIQPAPVRESGLAELSASPSATKPLLAGTAAVVQPAEMPPVQAAAVPDAPTRWTLPTKYVVGVGLFLALLFVVYISRSSLSMIIFAALLAFVVQPAINFFQRRWKMKRGSAVGLAYLLVIAVLILVPLVVIPAVIQSINGVLSMDWQTIGQDLAVSLQTAAQNASSIPVVGPTIASTLDLIAQLVSGAATMPVPAPVVVDTSAASIGGQLAKTLGKLASILGPLISAFVSLIFLLLISLRISLAAKEMQEAYPKLIPPHHKNEIIRLVEHLLTIWVSFLRGQLSLMVLMGFLTYLVNLLLGTPYPLFLGVLAGVMEIIPNLGPVLATIPAVILALILGSSWLPVSNLVFAIIIILAYIMLSALENQVIVPKILGDAVDLPPLVVIVGCVIGGAAFGLLGVFLATPVISTGKAIFGYLYNKILEPPPVIESPEEKPSMMDTFRGFTRRFWPPSRRREQKPLPDQSPAGKTEDLLG